MADIQTTNIMDLPTDPVGGGNLGGGLPNISQQNYMQPSTSGVSLDQSTINQIVNGLQQASISGSTNLPSRDIPMDNQHLTHDVEIQPNYIPVNEQKQYIENYPDNYYETTNTEKVGNTLDNLYDEIQNPLIISILYFLFQLPIFKKYIFQYLPFLCATDGQYNVSGTIFISILFAIVYYSIMKFTSHFNRI